MVVVVVAFEMIVFVVSLLCRLFLVGPSKVHVETLGGG